MKIGIFTDVHNNLIALETVIQKLSDLNCDAFICAGDIIGIGPYPNETVNLIRQLKNLTLVKGNHDHYLSQNLNNIKMDEEEKKHHIWEHALLSNTNKDFINNLPYETTLKIDIISIRVLHYSMNNNNEYINFKSNPTLEDLNEIFKNYNEDIIIYGHNHSSNIFLTNNKAYINVGSLGCPSNRKNIANAGILTIENNTYKFEKIEITYDSEKVVSKIKELNYPSSNDILKIFFNIK